MRLLYSMGQRDSAKVSNKNYMHWYKIIVYSCMTCGFDCPHTIECGVSHVTKYQYPRLSPFLSIFVRVWQSLGTRQKGLLRFKRVLLSSKSHLPASSEWCSHTLYHLPWSGRMFRQHRHRYGCSSKTIVAALLAHERGWAGAPPHRRPPGGHIRVTLTARVVCARVYICVHAYVCACVT